MPTDALDEAKALAQELELGQIKEGKLLDDGDNNESNDDFKEEKNKIKKINSTKDDIKTLKEEIEGLALGSRKFQKGVTCRRCRNKRHYIQ